jgi:serine/threonine protein kinase/tetratricopeptide (TPR) repeat protein
MTIECPKCQTDNPDTVKFCGECGTPLEADAIHTKTLETPREELSTGVTFAGRYQIIEEIGKGGMGKVYKVLDTKIKEKIALKLIKPEIAKDKKTIERFNNELKLARKIRHKNVCQMFDLGEERGTQFITMEYVSGEDLRSSIRRFGQLPIGKSLSVALQICEGLAEAHKQGVVHRDLKSNNIMVDQEGNVRIMDFGIARSLESKGITGSGVMIGTPEYMSPEQVEGKDVDQRTDVYSLGIIFYEMLTGRVPFEGDTPFTVGVKQKSELPQNPKKLNSQIPDSLNKVILKCLEKEKNKRYQSAGEVRSNLLNIEKGIPTTEREIPAKKPLTSREITVTVGIKKVLIPVMIILAAVVIGTGLWLFLPKKEEVSVPPPELPSLAVMYFENNTGDSGMDHYRKVISNLLITDLSQSKYLEVLSGAKLYNILNKMGKLEEKTFSSEVLKEVARQGSLSYVLVGGYSKAGDLYRLNYTLLEAESSDIFGSDTVQGRGEESIWTMVDDITKKIKVNLNLSQEMLADDFDMDIGEITSSPEAYKYYSEGTMYDHLGQWRKSVEIMEKAIEIDPNFAMAYRSMGLSYGDMGYLIQARDNLRKALELSHRVSQRERYQIEGDYYWYTEEYEKAIEVYSKKLELYPRDTDANVNLGAIYRDLEEWEKAKERFEVLRQAGDESIFSYLLLGIVYMAQESYDKAQEVAEFYLENFSDNVLLRFNLVDNYIYQGKLDLALSEIEKAAILDPKDFRTYWRKGIIFGYKDELDAAEQEYNKLLKLEEPRAYYEGNNQLANLCLLQGQFEQAKEHLQKCITWAEELAELGSKAWSYGYLAYIHMVSGNNEKAIEELEKSWKVAVAAALSDYQTYNFYLQGLVYVNMTSMDKAREVAEEFRARVEQSLYKNNIRDYFHLMGEIELKKGNFSKAIEYLNQALPLYFFGPLNKPAIYLETLASAFYQNGEINKAKAEYEKITSLTSGRLLWGHIYAKAFYMLAKIYEQQGDTSRAKENYEKFLSLWKDADPGLPEVADAKKRLAKLQIHPI